MSLPPPDSVDTQDFQFKILCRLRIFSGEKQYNSHASLVAAAPAFGLIFVGTPRGFQVIESAKVAEIQAARGETSEYPHREILLDSRPSHFSVSCNCELLAVGLTSNGCPCAIIYDVTSIGSENPSVVTSIRLATTPENTILDMQFNPGIPKMLATCTSDGGVAIYEFTNEGINVSTLPPATHATCLCWSPKGKQLVVGDQRGVLTQYKPDLKPVKNYPPPGPSSASVVSVQWLSNYQFAAVYSYPSNPDERPGLVIVNVPKGGGVTYVNFEDICYSAGELRPPQFYIIHLPAWNVMMVASANSMEVGVLGLTTDGVTWQQWIQEDAARAELPLTSDKQETYPLGISLDTSTTRQLPWGENNFLQPMPMLAILSHDGVLCLYHAINLHPQAVAVCSPPNPLPDRRGLDQFVMKQEPPSPISSLSIQTMQPIPSQQPTSMVAQSTSQPTQHSAQAPTSLMVAPTSQPGGALGGFSKTNLFGSIQTSSASPFTVPSPSSAPSFSAPTLTPAKSSGSAAFSSGGGDFATKLQGSLFDSGSAMPSFGSLPTSQPSSQPLTLQNQHQATLSLTPSSSSENSSKPLPPLVPVPKVDDSLQQTQQVNAPQAISTAETPDDKGEAADPAVFAKLIADEIAVFANELEKLRDSVSRELEPVGTQEEKKELLQKVESLEQFTQELKETTQAQNGEIQCLKSVLMESFAWVEDAKSRHQQLSNPKFLKLVRAQELDPVSMRHMSNIRQWQHYIRSQLNEVEKHLDSQWGQFQDSMRPPKNRLYIPTMESVYQTMRTHNDILNKQRCIVDDIIQRIALRKLVNSARTPLISAHALARKPAATKWRDYDAENDVNGNGKGENDLSKLAENLLEMKLGQKPYASRNSEIDTVVEMASNLSLSRFRTVVANQSRLTRFKEEKLRERLSQQPMTRIKPDRTPFEMGSSTYRPTCSFASSVLPLMGSSPTKLVHKPKSDIKTKPMKAPEIESSVSSTPSQTETALPSYSFSSGNQAAGVHQRFSFTTSSHVTSTVSSGLQVIAPPIPGKPTGAFSTFTSQSALPMASSTPAKPPKANLPPTTGKPAGISSVTPEANSKAPLSNTGPPTSAAGKQEIMRLPTSSQVTGSAVQGGNTNVEKLPFGSGETATKLHVTSTGPSTSVGVSDGGSVKNPLASLNSFVDNLTPDLSNSKPVSTENSKSTVTSSAASSSVSGFPAKTSFSLFASPQTQVTTAAAPAAPSAPPASVPSVFPKTPSSSGFSFSPQLISSAASSFSFSKSTGSSSFSFSPQPASVSASSPSTAVTTAVSGTTGVTTKTTTPFTFSFGSPAAATAVSPAATSASTTTPSGATTESSAVTSSPAASQPTPAPASSTSSFAASAVAPSTASSTTSSAAPVSPVASKPGDTGKKASGFRIQDPGIFSSTQSSVPPSGSPVQTKSPLLPTPSVTSTAQPSFFGSPATTTAPVSAAADSSSGTASLFGSLGLGGSTDTTNKSAGNIFGGGAGFQLGKASTPSLFGPPSTANTASTTTSSGSSDLVTALTSSANKSIFGTAATVPSSGFSFGSSLFGSPPSTTTGTSAPAVPSSSSSFSFAPLATSVTPESTATASTVTASTPVSTSVFSQPAAAAATSAGSVFGTPSSASTPLFGQPASSSATSTTASSAFTFAPQASSVASSTASSTSFTFALPASTATTTTQPVFGSSLFGQAATATATPATTSQTSFFGQPICSPSAFGQAGNAFGSTTSTTKSPTAQNVFGQSTVFGGKPTFGQSGGSLFGQSTGSTAFGGTGSSSIFGGGSSSTASIFGGGSTAPSSGNLFQQAAASNTSLFGGAPSSPSSGAFSGGMGGTISQSGFGSPPSFQSRPGGFGGTPAFQSPGSSAFGSPPAFGGAPTFGGAPAFGSPPKVFGSTSPTAFGSTMPTQQSTTFEALATQDSGLTFGNLAQSGQQPQQQQQQAPPQQTGNLFGSSPPAFSNPSSSFGGSSFSSWRR